MIPFPLPFLAKAVCKVSNDYRQSEFLSDLERNLERKFSRLFSRRVRRRVVSISDRMVDLVYFAGRREI